MNEFDIITQRVLACHIKDLETAYLKAKEELAEANRKIIAMEQAAKQSAKIED